MRKINLKQCKINGGFFENVLKKNSTVTVNTVYNRFKETGRIDALNCGKGQEKTHIFWDSDVAKWVEATAYILYNKKDEDLRKKYDDVIDSIIKNQKENGYYNSYFQVYEPENIFTDRDKHELYCAGHIFEAGVACKTYLDDDRLLNFSSKYVDYITDRFTVKKDTGFTTPGHEEIELALMRLYTLTNDKKYLNLAKFFIDNRGTENDVDKEMYNQSDIPVRDITTADGHAVRALYLYSGMADVALSDGDTQLKDALIRVSENIMNKRMYITGGTGSAYEGEKFTSDYDLPNKTAYSETCASIALAFFSDRMFRLTKDKKYEDLFERVLYNGVLAGVSLDGSSFFYTNPLEINANSIKYNENYANRRFRQVLPIIKRVEVFDCSCCPPNICRFFADLAEYIWQYEDDTFYLSQYITSSLKTDKAEISVVSDFPYSAKIKLTVNSLGNNITLKLRKPEWCKKNFKNQKDGFIVYNGVFKDKVIELDFGMQFTKIYANPKVNEDLKKVAFSYGPIVFCAEGCDNKKLFGTFIPSGDLSPIVKKNKDTVLKAVINAKYFKPTENLYSDKQPKVSKTTLTLIPYFTWANRTISDMKIWFPY